MPPFRWDRILVATDFSSFSKAAVNHAHQLAEKFAAELHVLHVVGNVTEGLFQYRRRRVARGRTARR